MKIGIYAGTFDPVHNGHLEFAKAAANQAGLRKVVIVAEKEPYRKKPHASWDHRQAMISRATEDIPQVDHDYRFASKLAHKYTMQNMIEVAEAHYGSEPEFWFLVGSDIFEHMYQWKNLIKEDQYGGFIVALRDDHTLSWLKSKQEFLSKHGIPVKTELVQNTHPHISSSKIREQIKQNAVEIATLPKSVAEYIFNHKLYKN